MIHRRWLRGTRGDMTIEATLMKIRNAPREKEKAMSGLPRTQTELIPEF
jgi:hypothetical protein